MDLTLTAYSTALFSTWMNVEELNLLIDAGDGLTAALMQKARKIKYVFITHADRDHLSGLTQFNQLNAREGFPRIFYPKDCGSFPALEAFQANFDPHISGSVWKGIEDGMIIGIKPNYEVQAIRNEHVLTEAGVHKSLSYKVYELKRKLKPEFMGLPKAELKRIGMTQGAAFLTDQFKSNLISFSGDTPVDDYGKWDKSNVLVHECTFLKDEGDPQSDPRGNRHSKIEEVFRMLTEIEVGVVVLSHFSVRYSALEIEETTRRMIKKYNIQIPIHVIYPGEIKRNILKSMPLNF